MHNGFIEVEDNKPCGSVFIINLPITKNENIVSLENNDSSEIKDIVSEAYDYTTITDSDITSLLIVEDNDDFRQFLVDCLSGKYNVLCACDGIMALDILSKNNISLVISDVMMPNMDGMELCHKIKTNIKYSHIPIILLTARTAEEHILSGLKEGADDYITKPFNLEIPSLRIEKILKWTTDNHKNFSRKLDISPSEITVSKLDETLIEKAIKVLEENIDNSDFSVEDLSAALGMSRGHLYKKLITITGKSPIEFIRILRLKRGKQLLEQSQLSISEISYKVGLSPKQFTKYFKEEFGEIPSKWVRNSNSGNIEIPENL